MEIVLRQLKLKCLLKSFVGTLSTSYHTKFQPIWSNRLWARAIFVNLTFFLQSSLAIFIEAIFSSGFTKLAISPVPVDEMSWNFAWETVNNVSLFTPKIRYILLHKIIRNNTICNRGHIMPSPALNGVNHDSNFDIGQTLFLYTS